MKPTRKDKSKGRKPAPRAEPRTERAAPAKKDVDDFVEDMEDPDEDYAKGVEEVSRLVAGESGA